MVFKLRRCASALAAAVPFAMALAGPTAAAEQAIGVWVTSMARISDAVLEQPWPAGDGRGSLSLATTGGRALGGPKPALFGPRLQGRSHALDGVASYYWQGQKTATGEAFDRRGMTAAHKTLPFGSKVRVTRIDTGDSVVVRINDRGPFKPGRVIDLSERAAQEIGMTGRGLAAVKIEVIEF